MKLAFSTNAFTRFSLTDALRGIHEAGFEGVEILADVPHAYPPQIDAAFTRSVAVQLHRLNLAVSNINCNCSFGYWKDAPPEPYFEPSLISPNPRHRQDRSQMILASLQFAHDLGAANISITSGRCLGGMPPPAAAKQFADGIKPILDAADRLGVNVGIECEPGLFLEYVAELREWIDKLKHPRFGANLDIGHSVVVGEDIRQAVQTLAGHIWNMHVEDLPGRKHYHTIPGHGNFDWSVLQEVLQHVHYDRFLTVELYTQTADPQGAANESCQFLRRIFPPPNDVDRCPPARGKV